MTADDPAAVAADDELLDALSLARLTDDTEAVLRLLAGWRREGHAGPLPELVDAVTAAALIDAARELYGDHR
ncbi:MAG: hypothetical protein ACRDSS_07940 [Actinocrinis sp.]